MNSSDYLAIFTAIIVAIIAPSLLALLTGRQARQAKQQDWARQDEVAAKAAEVAAEQLQAQQDALARTEKAARLAAAESLDIKEQLKIVHHLVNNDLTSARQAELREVNVSRDELIRIIEMTADRGLPNDPQDTAALATKNARITELQTILADRAAVMVLVEKEQKEAREERERLALDQKRETP